MARKPRSDSIWWTTFGVVTLISEPVILYVILTGEQAGNLAIVGFLIVASMVGQLLLSTFVFFAVMILSSSHKDPYPMPPKDKRPRKSESSGISTKA
jgi:uncharacterized membrane protein